VRPAPASAPDVRAGYLHSNRIWDIGTDGSSCRTRSSGFPTTAGDDLTTGWGSVHGFGYVDGLLNLP